MDMKHKVMDGSEPFEFRGAPLPSSVKDFWAWSMSRLIADGPRGMDMTEPKRGWGECDIVYPHGGKPVRIEVKCSTLLQAWERPSPPKPVFSIAKTLNCDIEDTGDGYRYIGRDGSPPKRRSDIYVFCVFAEEDRSRANPMVLDQWRFYVVPTAAIDEQLGDQRKISLLGLSRIGAIECSYDEIRPTVDRIAAGIGT